MTIEVSLLLSGVSIAFAIFFGISTRNRNVKKDTQDEAREDATILTKLENIQNTMIEVKSEMGSYRNEMKEIREYYIRASESLKQLHKRVDRIDKIIDESHPHQYIEEYRRKARGEVQLYNTSKQKKEKTQEVADKLDHGVFKKSCGCLRAALHHH